MAIFISFRDVALRRCALASTETPARSPGSVPLLYSNDFSRTGFFKCVPVPVFFCRRSFSISRLHRPHCNSGRRNRIGIRFITGKPAALSATDAVCDHSADAQCADLEAKR